MAANISIIVPSFDGYRGGNVPKLLDDLKRQSLKGFELHIVQGIKPNGRARNEGVKLAKGDYLVFIDDDVRLGNEFVIENLIKALKQDEDIGIAGTSRLLPPDANKFQKRASMELPRSIFPVVKNMVETDMATHDCMAIRRQVYESVGGENERLVRGTDPDLRYRIRKNGLKVVVIPDTWIYHPLPDNVNSLIQKGFKNGIGAAWVFRNFPELAYETPEGNVRNFVPKRNFMDRAVRGLMRILLALVTFKFILLTYRLAYACGDITGLFRSDEEIEEITF